MLRFKRRLRNYGLVERSDIRQNLYAYRSHGTPCSCFFCQQTDKAYNRAKEKEYTRKTADPISECVLLGEKIFVRNMPFISDIEGCD